MSREAEPSAPGSRLAAEIFVSLPDVNGDQPPDLLQTASERWRSRGFGIEVADQRYDVERNGVAAYPNGHGWQAEPIKRNAPPAQHGLQEIPVMPAGAAFSESYYRTAIRRG
ncbi:hypothetical protein [Mycobacterium sp. 050134]|uniref:hypothetical protein n=1 Tax=Mycobacterium sp. 050134 TaxID=3096111 RepID=UPI002ED96254